MSRILAAMAVSIVCAATSPATAQVPLTSYVDANGFIDVQALTCAQLAGTFQEDADLLSAWYSGWYSGWYNGLAKKHFLDLKKGKVVEHERQAGHPPEISTCWPVRITVLPFAKGESKMSTSNTKLGAGLALAMFSIAAQAADLPSRRIEPAAPLPPASPAAKRGRPANPDRTSHFT